MSVKAASTSRVAAYTHTDKDNRLVPGAWQFVFGCGCSFGDPFTRDRGVSSAIRHGVWEPTSLPNIVEYNYHDAGPSLCLLRAHKLLPKPQTVRQIPECIAACWSRSDYKSCILLLMQVETACQPIVYNKDLYVSSAIDGTPLIANETANPCGLVAYTVFNDSFQLSQSGNAIYINDSGISWPSDIARYP